MILLDDGKIICCGEHHINLTLPIQFVQWIRCLMYNLTVAIRPSKVCFDQNLIFRFNTLHYILVTEIINLLYQWMRLILEIGNIYRKINLKGLKQIIMFQSCSWFSTWFSGKTQVLAIVEIQGKWHRWMLHLPVPNLTNSKYIFNFCLF